MSPTAGMGRFERSGDLPVGTSYALSGTFDATPRGLMLRTIEGGEWLLDLGHLALLCVLPLWPAGVGLGHPRSL